MQNSKIKFLLISLLIFLLARLGLFYSSWQSMAVSDIKPPAVFMVVRDRVVAVYGAVLTGRQTDLASGVVLGSKGLDAKFKARLATVGLTHVVAASGMNVTFFSGFVMWALSGFRWRKQYKVVVMIGMILFYSCLTGFEPPIVRASLMASLALAAGLVGRKSDGWWGLLAACYIMLWGNPALLTSASFLLSFSAMASQIFLSSFWRSVPNGGKVITRVFNEMGRNFFQSFLAILFTFPIIVYFFSKFSLVSLISNLVTLWTIEPIMILGGLLGVLGLVSINLARTIAYPLSVLLDYFLWVVDSLGSNPMFLLNIKMDSWIFVVGYYLTLGGFVWWWVKVPK